MPMYDWTMILLIPAMLISGWAQAKVMSNYNTYKQVACRKGVTGAQVARHLLDTRGLGEIDLEPVQGKLTDHFDPKTRKIRLSQDVFYGNSISSVSIAAHECGHAMQYGQKYFPLVFRNALALPASIASRGGWLILLIGLSMMAAGDVANGNLLFRIGIYAFAAVVLFHAVTLPVELDASRRALNALTEDGILADDEIQGSQKVLGAAALTYMAALFMTIMQLLQIFIIRGRRNG